MQSNPETKTGPYYTWKPAGKTLSVQLPFDAIDRILLEVVRGFGAVPKRGAEVGGILLGSVDTQDGQTVVTVEEFESVGCDHASGPSYVLSEDDRASFAEAVSRWQPGPDRPVYAVGYYRGHTRDGVCLAAEDLSILDELFPDPAAIALVVKPYATKVSVAGIFFREEGQFNGDASALEFPFRRKELGGGSSGMERLASAARFGQQRTPDDPTPWSRRSTDATGRRPAAAPSPAPPPPPAPVQELYEVPAFAASAAANVDEKKKKGVRSGWVWIPLSFIFMLLGVVVGFQIAMSMRPKQPANPWIEAWDLSLQVKRTGDALAVTWDPLAPAVRNANRGALIIQSRDETRTIELKGPQLQGGSVIYRGVPERVLFRLEVYPRERGVVSEITEFQTVQ